MRKIIARIVALLVCAFAAVVIYNVATKAYFHEAINDFVAEGEKFSQNQLVAPEKVEHNTTNGKFVYAIAVYWRNFQDANNEMDAETNKLLASFNQKSLGSAELVAANLVRLNQYKLFVQSKTEQIDKGADNLVSAVSALEQSKLELGSIEGVKIELAKSIEFRKKIAEIRKSIANYMYVGLEFLQSRQQTISFAENGSINFANPADQKYFYDLMGAIVEYDKSLKNMLVENRNNLRKDVTAMKSAYEKVN